MAEPRWPDASPIASKIFGHRIVPGARLLHRLIGSSSESKAKRHPAALCLVLEPCLGVYELVLRWFPTGPVQSIAPSPLLMVDMVIDHE